MRKSFNGLQAVVTSELKKNTLSGHFFVFSNRRRDLLKILYYVLVSHPPEATQFILAYRFRPRR
jgi:transposase